MIFCKLFINHASLKSLRIARLRQRRNGSKSRWNGGDQTNERVSSAARMWLEHDFETELIKTQLEMSGGFDKDEKEWIRSSNSRKVQRNGGNVPKSTGHEKCVGVVSASNPETRIANITDRQWCSTWRDPLVDKAPWGLPTMSLFRTFWDPNRDHHRMPQSLFNQDVELAVWSKEVTNECSVCQEISN